jgi:DNA-binding IclR family transcriptional regulator
MTDNGNNTVDAVRTAFSVLEALERLEGAGVTELARELDHPKSTVHNHLQTLVDEEYVVREADGEYRIALRHLKFGEHARNRTVFRVAKPEVRKLAAETGEHANFTMREHGYGVYVYKDTGDKAVKLDTYPGKRVYLHTTAFGKAMLAFVDEAERDAVLDRHGLPEETENTITDRAALDEELEAVRDRGYAIDDGERLVGMRCVAAPVRNSDGAVLGAVSVSGPASRFEPDYLHGELADDVVGAANVVEINATYA